MTKQEFLDAITSIGTCEDDVERRTLLDQLRDEVSADYDSLTNLENQNTQYQQDNETLRAANMKLFLKVGEQKEESKKKEDSTGIKEDEESELKFEDLIDEKGDLK